MRAVLRLILLFALWSLALHADVKLGDHTIAEEKDGSFRSGQYVAPNEYHPYFFKSYLKGRNGVLIATGTFRAFHSSTYGNFSHTFLVDIDAFESGFNKILIEMFKQAKSRHEFFSLLFTGEINADLVTQFRDASSPEKIVEILDKFEVREVLSKWIRNLPEAAFKDSVYKNTELSERVWIITQKILESFRGYNEKGTVSETIFGSDAMYETVRQKAFQNHYIVLQGDLTGDTLIPSMSRALRGNRLEVGAVDLSNIVDYFHGSLPAMKRFMKNLRGLPWNTSASVVFTSSFEFEMPARIMLNSPDGSIPEPRWAYYGMSHVDFLNGQFIKTIWKEVSGIRDVEAYFRLMIPAGCK